MKVLLNQPVDFRLERFYNNLIPEVYIYETSENRLETVKVFQSNELLIYILDSPVSVMGKQSFPKQPLQLSDPFHMYGDVNN